MGSKKAAERTNVMKNVQYCFGFVDTSGTQCNYHMSDSLQDPTTWKSVEFKFSAPGSQYLFVWRRDNKAITDEESQILVKYVKEDMEEFTNEGDTTGPGTQTRILHMLSPSRECLIMAYDEFDLPGSYEDWDDFAYFVFDIVHKMSENSVEHSSDDEKIDQILNGNVLFDPEKDR